MTRETIRLIHQEKLDSTLLVRYANPRSRKKPSYEEIVAILSRYIPYCGTVRPVIKSVIVSRFHRNPIIRSGYFTIILEDGKKWSISAYENLKGRTSREKEEDKIAQYPSGLFKIFHDEIKE